MGETTYITGTNDDADAWGEGLDARIVALRAGSGISDSLSASEDITMISNHCFFWSFAWDDSGGKRRRLTPKYKKIQLEFRVCPECQL
jgi:hypothetical protein